jgi:hypothetical protein
MRFSALCVIFVLAGIAALSLGAFALSVYWWHEAFVPMTSERYAELCGNAPECYAEAGYLIDSILAAVIAFAAASGLFLGVVLDRASRRSPPACPPISPRRGSPLI